ncbi:uncharacterized protein LOC133250038 [Bos javanicus]|uniref:uncharacterized protein LOC133250038 n=1 Tax=Bos javanicus TaxID=9906 RepID=UPI002AA6675B|nr:uncharacterized protein LOC133250038 [Bos javanicus]
MKQIKMNYSPGPPSHPLTSKRGMSSASDLRRDHAAVSACAEIELLFRGNQSIRRKQKWKSRFGKTCHFPDLSGAGWGRRLGRLKRGPFSHLSAFPRTSRRENDPPHLPFPTHPGSAFSPFLHLLFPSSEKSLVPELTESVPSPLPLPRGSPPPTSPVIVTATTSVPLNRFLLQVNIYYRFSDRGEKNPVCKFRAAAPGAKLPSPARSLLASCSPAGLSSSPRLECQPGQLTRAFWTPGFCRATRPSPAGDPRRSRCPT